MGIQNGMAKHLNQKESHALSKEIVDTFFALCSRKYNECGLHTSPQSIWCVDEAEFSGNVIKLKPICSKGNFKLAYISYKLSHFILKIYKKCHLALATLSLIIWLANSR